MIRKTSTSLCTVTILLLLILSSALAGPDMPYYRVRSKKYVSDQRIAELQALIALASRIQTKPKYGHGHIDPFAVGRRRKRSVDSVSYWNALQNDHPLRVKNATVDIEAVRKRLKPQ